MNLTVAGSFLSLPVADWIDFLFNASLKVTLLVLGCVFVTRLLQRQSAAIRSLVWSIGLSGCVLLTLLPLAAILWPATDSPLWLPRPPRLAWMLTLADQPRTAEVLSPAEITPGYAASDADMYIPDTVIGSAQLETDLHPALIFFPHWTVLGPAIWFCGCLLLLIRSLRGFVTGWHAQARATTTTDPRIERIISTTSRKFGLHTRVEVKMHPTEAIPFITGILRPSLVLPARAAHWDAANLQAVIWHELAHIKRGDLLTLAAIEIVRACNWFNPLVWWATRRAQLEIEIACDDCAVTSGAPVQAYARQLLQLIADFQKFSPQPVGVLAMASRSDLEERMIMILNPRTQRKPLSRLMAIMIAGTMVLTALPLAAVQVVEQVDTIATARVTAASVETTDHSVVTAQVADTWTVSPDYVVVSTSEESVSDQKDNTKETVFVEVRPSDGESEKWTITSRSKNDTIEATCAIDITKLLSYFKARENVSAETVKLEFGKTLDQILQQIPEGHQLTDLFIDLTDSNVIQIRYHGSGDTKNLDHDSVKAIAARVDAQDSTRTFYIHLEDEDDNK